MRIIYPAVLSTDWLDRASSWLVAHGDLSLVAPHVANTRFDYTIATGKKMVLDGGILYIRREAVAAPVGLVNMIAYVTNGGNTYAIGMVETANNTIDVQFTYIIPGNIYLYTGDRIRVQTSDASTGGSIHYLYSLHLNLYSA